MSISNTNNKVTIRLVINSSVNSYPMPALTIMCRFRLGIPVLIDWLLISMVYTQNYLLFFHFVITNWKKNSKTVIFESLILKFVTEIEPSKARELYHKICLSNIECVTHVVANEQWNCVNILLTKYTKPLIKMNDSNHIRSFAD